MSDDHAHGDSTAGDRPLRVLSIWHGAARRLNRERYDALARTDGLDLTLLAPEVWSAAMPRELAYEPGEDAGYRVIRARPWLLGHGALHFYPRLFSILSAERPDLIDVYEEPYSLIAWLVAWWRNNYAPGCRFVFTACQNIAKRYPPPFGWMERYVLQSADAAMALNRGAVEVFRDKGYDGPFEIVPTGIDPDRFRRVDGGRFRQQLPADRFVVGYVGRLVEEKGVATLLEAAAVEPGRYSVLIVGDGPEKAALDRQARDLSLGDAVCFVDAVSSDEVCEVMSAMDALVLPSRTRANWKEQLGRVLIEAMALGIPVIGSRSGAIPDVIGDGGLIFEEGDARALHREITRLIDDPDLQGTLSKRGRRRAETEFAWPTIARQTRDLWQRALEQPSLEVRVRK